MYLTGAQNESGFEDQAGSPKNGTARANSCMERLLRDEQRRKEARM